MKFWAASLFMFSFLTINAENGSWMTVTTSEGMRLRKAPSTNETQIAFVPFKGIVKILAEDGPQETIYNVTARWYKVEYQDKVGWMFSAFLKPITADTPLTIEQKRAMTESTTGLQIGKFREFFSSWQNIAGLIAILVIFAAIIRYLRSRMSTQATVMQPQTNVKAERPAIPASELKIMTPNETEKVHQPSPKEVLSYSNTPESHVRAPSATAQDIPQNQRTEPQASRNGKTPAEYGRIIFEKFENYFVCAMVIAFFLPWFSLGLFSFSAYSLPQFFGMANQVQIAFSPDSGPSQIQYLYYGIYLIFFLPVAKLFSDLMGQDSRRLAWATAIAPWLLLLFALKDYQLSQILSMASIGFYLTFIASICIILIMRGILKKSTQQQ